MRIWTVVSTALLLYACLASSCTFEKRLYRNGFYVGVVNSRPFEGIRDSLSKTNRTVSLDLQNEIQRVNQNQNIDDKISHLIESDSSLDVAADLASLTIVDTVNFTGKILCVQNLSPHDVPAADEPEPNSGEWIWPFLGLACCFGSIAGLTFALYSISIACLVAALFFVIYGYIIISRRARKRRQESIEITKRFRILLLIALGVNVINTLAVILLLWLHKYAFFV